MGIFSVFRRKPTMDDGAQRTRLLRAGRIAEGTIIDTMNDDDGAITQIFYTYNIGGVEYESSQPLDDAQRLHSSDYFPGARVTIRFDPHQHGNSIVV